MPEEEAIVILKQIINGVAVSLKLCRKCTGTKLSIEILRLRTLCPTTASTKLLTSDSASSLTLPTGLKSSSIHLWEPSPLWLRKCSTGSRTVSRYFYNDLGRYMVHWHNILPNDFWDLALHLDKGFGNVWGDQEKTILHHSRAIEI